MNTTTKQAHTKYHQTGKQQIILCENWTVDNKNNWQKWKSNENALRVFGCTKDLWCERAWSRIRTHSKRTLNWHRRMVKILAAAAMCTEEFSLMPAHHNTAASLTHTHTTDNVMLLHISFSRSRSLSCTRITFIDHFDCRLILAQAYTLAHDHTLVHTQAHARSLRLPRIHRLDF